MNARIRWPRGGDPWPFTGRETALLWALGAIALAMIAWLAGAL